ncbi:prepilin-type N-terminal cleavage/methylation domain-containing protein [Tepidanaerobacter sp. EBM-38]|uniref:prepilin-type N-terminal cleavage/methylation domain-containing protein n=1 Tax=Tepidanaerobacter sp. EBM-38 TaxID=1918496 RepID=UPI000B071DAC|nr:prepilin-type N-terminal cleavage/methylation domain-containing protein [Tepidanaerobacter sp. EBM-38]
MLHIEANTKRKNGFTLIELILSLGLLSLILTTSFNLYDAGQKSYENENNKIFAQQNARQAFLWLSTSVKQARSVEVISENSIKIVTSDGEKLIYYFENGVLYRQKNNGTNPIAELSQLKFKQPKDKKYVEIFLAIQVKKGDDIIIKTKATPFGSWIN